MQKAGRLAPKVRPLRTKRAIAQSPKPKQIPKLPRYLVCVIRGRTHDLARDAHGDLLGFGGLKRAEQVAERLEKHAQRTDNARYRAIHRDEANRRLKNKMLKLGTV